LAVKKFGRLVTKIDLEEKTSALIQKEGKTGRLTDTTLSSIAKFTEISGYRVNSHTVNDTSLANSPNSPNLVHPKPNPA